MIEIDGILKQLRRAPEPLKRHLRPALVRAVALARAVPGSAAVFAVVRRAAPGLHGWLRRRHAYYVDNALGAAAAPARTDPGELDFDGQLALGWLRRAGAGRVN